MDKDIKYIDIENVSASALANYLLHDNPYTKGQITNLHLQKIIYIIHGFSLALENLSIINDDYDEKIEAWKLGPVVPSVYHEMKEYGNNIIKSEKISLLTQEINDNQTIINKPSLSKGSVVRSIAEWVVEKILTVNNKIQHVDKLVNFTYLEGSPWHDVYKSGMHNIIIDNKSIKEYFIWYKNWLYDTYKVSYTK